MVKNNTLIVLGAGASNEVGMPIGRELKEVIAQLLDIRFQDGIRQSSGDRYICESLRSKAQINGRYGDINPLLKVCWHIRDALPQAISIDNFIDNHRQDDLIEFCGKLGIARSILTAEKESLLWVDSDKGHPDFRTLQKTWYASLFQLLTENCTQNDLAERLSNIKFIVFNYDRCLEQYLFHAFQNFYKTDSKQTANLIQNIEIFHPYGTVGLLPWQQPHESVEFGGSLTHPQRLIEAASRIKTFTQGTDVKSSEIGKIKKSIANADILIFLGFAFHRQNLELLCPNKIKQREDKPKMCYATAYGMSVADARIIGNDIKRLFSNTDFGLDVRYDLKCCELFQQFWRSLAISFSS